MRPASTFPKAERDWKDARQQFDLNASLRNAIAREDAAQRFFFAKECRYER